MADALESATTRAMPVLRVQICHALPDEAFIETLSVPAGATIAQALAASGLHARFPALAATLEAGDTKVGIFGKVKPLDTMLRDGDRIEIYRPLQADPKESRRRRAKHKQQLDAR
jgi:putative ubiquitin-RnfH superfamily antitoxin RatB of RatAB toxin-antitoxin module